MDDLTFNLLSLLFLMYARYMSSTYVKIMRETIAVHQPAITIAITITSTVVITAEHTHLCRVFISTMKDLPRYLNLLSILHVARTLELNL